MHAASCIGLLHHISAELTLEQRSFGLAGDSGSHSYLAGLNLSSARANQLLLQTVNSAQSYPPFALLPLLRGSQKQGAATFWPANHLTRRRHHVKPPCFAARPLYVTPQPQPLPAFPMRVPNTHRFRIAATQNAQAPSHPLYKYAALGRVQLIQSVPVAANQQGALTGLHTYAGLARPVSAGNQAVCTKQQSRQALQQFAQLGKRSVAQSSVKGASAKAADSRSALKSYALLSRRS